MTSRVLVVMSSLSVLLAGCSSWRFTVPTAPAVPVADGAERWVEATRGCRAIQTFAADLRLAGRGGVRLAVAFDAEGHLAVDARTGAAQVFSLRGVSNAATLVLPQDRRVVTAPIEAILDALVGLPLTSDRLLLILTGCVSRRPSVAGHTVASLIRIQTEDATVFLALRGGQWFVRGGTFDQVVVGYKPGKFAWPSEVSIVREGGNSGSARLSFSIETADERPRDPSVFVPVVPQGMAPETLDWLRAHPLVDTGRSVAR